MNPILYNNGFNIGIGANDPNQYYWDPTADVPYLYNRNTQIFSTYEDVHSIESKLDYVHDLGLGGMFFWEITADLPIYESDSLLQKAYNGLYPSQRNGSKTYQVPSNKKHSRNRQRH
ncbi:MAG: glycosyl hydrolase family 18 protein [Crocosphaera sp.]